MKRLRLNMWQRLGVVASVLWMLGAGIRERLKQVDLALIYYGEARDECAKTAADCSQVASAAYDRAIEGRWGEVVAVAVEPVVLGWVFAYITVWTARWILAGRHPRP